jgi:hypothetical protein
MDSEPDGIKAYFHCSPSERACFEAGIKLGALFHQFIGVPLSPSNCDRIEEAMREAVLSQPYVARAEVNLDRTLIRQSLTHFGYCTLEGRMIDAAVRIEVEGVRVTARLKQVEELRYPLMWVDKVEDIG